MSERRKMKKIVGSSYHYNSFQQNAQGGQNGKGSYNDPLRHQALACRFRQFFHAALFPTEKKRNENVSIRKIRSNEPENRFPCGLTTDPFRNRSILGKIIIYESGDRSGGRIEKKKKEFEKFRSRAEKFKQINVTYDFFLLLFVIKLMTMIWKYFTEKLSENRKDSKK